jgi:hypothetical protein
MEGSERDSTQDWVLPETALEAAEQARRAAGIAERAAATALDAQRRVAVAPLGAEEPITPRAGADGPDERLRDFAERADRIARRLRELSPATVGAVSPRSAR